ncbi:MAG: hypothetical protein ACOC3V_03560 [bacterium]
MTNKIMLILVMVVASGLGYGAGWLAKSLQVRVQIAELTAERDQAKLARQNMREQWEVAVNELNATKVILNDTLASLELLRQYASIDEQTQNDIKELKNTLDPDGEPTQETEDVFRSLVKKFNQLHGTVDSLDPNRIELLDLEPFKQVKRDAEKLYDETQEVVFEFGLGEK